MVTDKYGDRTFGDRENKLDLENIQPDIRRNVTS